MNSPLQYTGQSFTLGFEGCVLHSYQDSGGVWTIGDGHNGPDVGPGQTCTPAQAQGWLTQQLQGVVNFVNRVVTVQLDQDEFNAVVDFTYNCGQGNFANSSLLRDLNAGNFQGAAAQFDLWDHAGGQVVAGLLRRRQAETSLFEQGMGNA